jgi:hypothetical protein
MEQLVQKMNQTKKGGGAGKGSGVHAAVRRNGQPPSCARKGFLNCPNKRAGAATAAADRAGHPEAGG